MNDYHEKFQELQEQNTFRGQTWFGQRQKLVERYSWAVPNEDALVYLAEFDHLHELGAGSGYWANCIEDMGGDVTPIDKDPPASTWTDVHEQPVSNYLHNIEDEPVLMVWPPHDDRMSYQVARASPSHILYVGEPRGGCTGCDEFFDRLDKEYGLVAKVDIPSYEGVNDNLFHYVRKV